MSEPSPTEHWDRAYGHGPPWDIGRPQAAFLRLASEGRLRGRLLDIGCGTGEHTLLAAQGGAEAVGVDVSALAMARAREKAAERGLSARFVVGDALAAGDALGAFDVVVDSGLFHVFGDDDRPRYVPRLAELLVPGGRLYLMCFSDREPGDWGPRRVTAAELHGSFTAGWVVEDLGEDRFELRGGGTAQAWLARIRRS